MNNEYNHLPGFEEGEGDNYNPLIGFNLNGKNHEAFLKKEPADISQIKYEWVIKNLEDEGLNQLENMLKENFGNPKDSEEAPFYYFDGSRTNIIKSQDYNADGKRISYQSKNLTDENAELMAGDPQAIRISEYWGKPEKDKMHASITISEQIEPEQTQPRYLDSHEIIRR
ncbi:MAG: hypothetical protein ABEI74_01970 [Candidatus Pacearchaeota archaeon]